MSRKPLIGVSACTKQLGHHSFHIAGDKYLRAAAIAGLPLVIPALDELIDQENINGRPQPPRSPISGKRPHSTRVYL
ncbi:gamma-glutamyl-gamma-aminobutyrate hydrolase family protein, partial [Methylobacterium organophilum]|nr:gamma-glutamyl-gamma-aminobutyrate hydrolase family protein [Methylobacterium organophilum]